MQLRTAREADRAGQRHIRIEAEIAKREADLDAKIADLRKTHGDVVEDLKKENRKILEALADFYWANPEDLEKGSRQIILDTIKLSERTTQKYAWPRGRAVTSLIAKIKKLGYREFLRTKEEINKEKIRDEASADQLKALGIKVEPETTVYVEAR